MADANVNNNPNSSDTSENKSGKDLQSKEFGTNLVNIKADFNVNNEK